MSKETDILGPEGISGLLRRGFWLGALAMAGIAVQSFQLRSPVLPYQLMEVFVCLAAGFLTYGRDFSWCWREVTLGLCLFIVSVSAFTGVVTGEQVPLFVTILVIAAATGTLVPWEPGWQRALSGGFVAAALVQTILARPVNPSIGGLWLAMLTAAVLAMASNHMWSRWRATGTDDAPQAAARMEKLLDADLTQVSMVHLRGGRFMFVNQELVANLSHQLRNSLNALMGMADLLEGTQLDRDQRAYVDTMHVNGTALVDLIDIILDLAKIESGKLRLERKDFDLLEVIGRAAESLRTRAHEKHLELAIKVDSKVPLQLTGDPMRLHQVLVCLLDNAIKFTERGEVVLTVEAVKTGSKVTELGFAVADTGIGISAQQMQTIFQAFSHGDDSFGREYRGTGLGLAIAKRLTELMGGRIKAESERGKGSKFSFTASFDMRRAATVSDLAAGASLEEQRILLVEDNPTSAAMMEELLRARAASVVRADSLESALERLQSAHDAGRPFQLIVADTSMPEADGAQIIQQLSDRTDGARLLPILTADNLEAKLDWVRKFGLNSLVKPVMPAAFLRAVAIATGAPIEQSAEERPAQPTPPISVRPLRLLVADDSVHNRFLIKEYLKALPYQLDMAENGEVAFEKFTAGRYDLVLMDLRMPVMDGLTAVRRIRLWEHGQDRDATPIIALTASALEEDVRDSNEAGCTAHLSKPVKKARLLEMIRELTCPVNDSAQEAFQPAPVVAKPLFEPVADLEALRTAEAISSVAA